MVRRLLGQVWGAAVMMLAGLMLCGCVSLFEAPGSNGGQMNYDVRDGAVIASGSVPADVVSLVDVQLKAAIHYTVRKEPLPRVVVTVDIKSLKVDKDQLGYLAKAQFHMAAASVDNGSVVAEGNFDLMARGIDEKAANYAAAEEIASRVRYVFNLQRAPVIQVPGTNPMPLPAQVPAPKAPPVSGAAPHATPGGHS